MNIKDYLLLGVLVVCNVFLHIITLGIPKIVPIITKKINFLKEKLNLIEKK